MEHETLGGYAISLCLEGRGLGEMEFVLVSPARSVVRDFDTVRQRSVDWTAGGDFAKPIRLRLIQVTADDQLEVDGCGFALGWMGLETDRDSVERPLSAFGVQPNRENRSRA